MVYGLEFGPDPEASGRGGVWGLIFLL